MVKFIGMVGQPRRNSAKMVSWSRVSEHLVNIIGMSDQLKWNNHLSFDQYIDDNVFLKWIKMLEELDIVHPMVLYSMADTGMPIDCKTAFIIESFESLAELIKKYNKSFAKPSYKRGESLLQK